MEGFIYDPQSYLLGFRITLPEHIASMKNSYWQGDYSNHVKPWSKYKNDPNYKDPNEICEMYYIHIKNYLKAKNITILANIAGFHAQASQPHIHIHFNVVLNKAEPQDWIQNWKYYWKKEKIKFLYEKHKDESKINISIKGTPLKSKEDLEYYFAYTVKEGKNLPLLTTLNVIGELPYLKEIGTELYKKSKAQNAIKERGKKKQLSVYKRVIERIESRREFNNSLWEVARDVLEHFQTLPIEEQVEPQVLIKYARKYCYYNSIWDIESILEKYL